MIRLPLLAARSYIHAVGAIDDVRRPSARVNAVAIMELFTGIYCRLNEWAFLYRTERNLSSTVEP